MAVLSRPRSNRWGSVNVLGVARAEADNEMLQRAFVETSDFQALRNTDDFNFIVGRRGTGKTALFLRGLEEFERDKKIFAHRLKPDEHDSLALLSLLRKLGDGSYREVRPIARVLWRGSILLSVAKSLCKHWKYRRSPKGLWLREYTGKQKELLALNELQRCAAILRRVPASASPYEEVPGEIARGLNVSRLEDEVRAGLEMLDMRALFLFDGLDEGWLPDRISTAVLGGLAITVADLKDHDVPVHGELFIRDNIFRSLAVFDNDFSRHIEGSTLRLHWSEEGLFNLVANRLRVVLEMTNVENNNRVWNRFAHRELRDRDGFRSCLKHTLYRPRDVLVLLNGAVVRAARGGRAEIVQEDIDATSKQISLDRFADLLKEYESVFPGLSIIAKSFAGSNAFQTFESVRSRLQRLLDDESYSTREASDLAILGNSSQLLDALYSVGFVGLEDQVTKAVRFCHDGALSSISAVEGDRRVVVHPCYWKALDVTETEVEAEVLLDIHDDYENRPGPQLGDIRTKRLGQLVSDLPPSGKVGAQEYEKWLLRVCQILFAGELSNIELHPAPDAVQRRDVVATNVAERGFWKRILDDYGVRQVVFEAKNYSGLDAGDYRQAASYGGKQYGGLVILVTRSDELGLDDVARDWVKEMWDKSEVLLFVLPAALLVQYLKKTRSSRGRDYTDRSLMKRLDTFERSYLELRHRPKARKRRR